MATEEGTTAAGGPVDELLGTSSLDDGMRAPLFAHLLGTLRIRVFLHHLVTQKRELQVRAIAPVVISASMQTTGGRQMEHEIAPAQDCLNFKQLF